MMNTPPTNLVKFDPQLERLYIELESNAYPIDAELARLYDEKSVEVPVAVDLPSDVKGLTPSIVPSSFVPSVLL